MGYAVLIAVVFLSVALLFLGDALAIGIAVWSAVHLLRGRPVWYVGKILKGGVVGALTGLTVALAITLPAQGGLPDDGLYLVGHLATSGLGWGALAPARWYFVHRFETSGAPI
jgi:hypothetical protein